MGALMPMCMYTKSIIRKQFRAKRDFVCVPLRNFMGAPAPGAPMLPTPVNMSCTKLEYLCAWYREENVKGTSPCTMSFPHLNVTCNV